jgi:hypothetical protein
MASAADAPLVAFRVVAYVELFLLVLFIVVDLIAFVHCLRQRKEAFTVVGSVPKVGWLAISGLGAVFTFLLYGVPFIGSLIGFVVFTACVFYLLDLRIGLRDATGGHWR